MDMAAILLEKKLKVSYISKEAFVGPIPYLYIQADRVIYNSYMHTYVCDLIRCMLLAINILF